MRSLYVRLLVALVGTALASLVAFLATFFAMTRPAEVRLLHQFQVEQLEDAVATYERDGALGLSTYLERLNQGLDAEHYLIDANGRDLVTGEDRSTLLRIPRPFLGGPPELDGRLILVQQSPNRPYRLLIAAPPPFNVWAFVPYY